MCWLLGTLGGKYLLKDVLDAMVISNPLITELAFPLSGALRTHIHI